MMSVEALDQFALVFGAGFVVGAWWYSRSLRKEVAAMRATARDRLAKLEGFERSAREMHDGLKAHLENKGVVVQ